MDFSGRANEGPLRCALCGKLPFKSSWAWKCITRTCLARSRWFGNVRLWNHTQRARNYSKRRAQEQKERLLLGENR